MLLGALVGSAFVRMEYGCFRRKHGQWLREFQRAGEKFMACCCRLLELKADFGKHHFCRSALEPACFCPLCCRRDGGSHEEPCRELPRPE